MQYSVPTMNRFYITFVATICLLVMFFHLRLTGNPMSRLFTVFAVVEEGHLEADTWAKETEDKAVINGHTYSDKAPLSSFMVIPFFWAYRTVEGGPHTPHDHAVGLHLGTLVASALPFALLLMMFLWRLRQDGASPALSVGLPLVLGFTTVLFNYGNAYFGHMLATTCFVGAWVLAVDRKSHFALAGCLASLAVLAEYPTAILAALLVAWVAFQPGGVRQAARVVAGAAPGALALLAYNAVVTGNPFTLTYSHVTSQWEPMKTNYGMRLPDPSAAWELLFGQYRGLFFYSPLLLVLAPAWVASGLDRSRRLFGALLFCLYWLMMSSYFKWEGGWCLGPRHLLPVVGLLAYECVAAIKGRLPTPALAAFLALLGLGINLVAAATDPILNEGEPRPFFRELWPRLVRGEINPHNLAVELGIPNGRYLLVLFTVLLVVAGAALAWALARQDRRAPAPAPAPAA